MSEEYRLETSTDSVTEEEPVSLQHMKQFKLTQLWIEKYRPKTIEDLVIDEATMDKIKSMMDDKNMPNIIITGIPGIGKTTTVHCIAMNLLGKYYDQGILELNASDDRGIKAVQEPIIYFCKKKLEVNDMDKGKLANHKIVLLDEADNMTRKAQRQINNLMQKYHGTTRFAFTCNNSSDIIEAIQSRCIILRYSRLDNKKIAERLKHICKIEKVPYSEEGIDSLVLISQGDMRQAINNLQLTYNGYVDVISENVYKLCDCPHPLVIQNIFEACYKKDVKQAFTLLNGLRSKGYSGIDISLSMMDTLKNAKNLNIKEDVKVKYLNKICNTCLIISKNKGINTPIQLSGCIAGLCVEE